MNVLAAFLVFFVLAAVLVIGYSARTTGKVAKKAEAQDSPGDPQVETLRYRVPDGQDPTVLIGALDHAGYTADVAPEEGTKYLVIGCPGGRDRERARVRNILAENHMASIEGPSFSPGKVTFEDEKS